MIKKHIMLLLALNFQGRKRQHQNDQDRQPSPQRRVGAGGEQQYADGHDHGQVDQHQRRMQAHQRHDLDFEPRDHVELGERLGAIDIERGTKVSGGRFYFLRGVGAQLQWALLKLAVTTAIGNGFVPMIPPVLVKPEAMEGTGFLGAHADEIYRIEADDMYLVGTAEVPLAGYHAGEILDLSAGPLP